MVSPSHWAGNQRLEEHIILILIHLIESLLNGFLFRYKICMLSPFRLYYLFNGTVKVTLVKEKNIIKFLLCFWPLLLAIFSIIRIVKNLSHFGLANPPLFYYSYCGKTPFSTNLLYESKAFLVYGVICIISLASEMCCHITILVKQTQIETRADIYVLKDNKVISKQRHQRNIVSALGHFASFFISMVQLCFLLPALFFSFEVEEITLIRNLILFFIPATEFLIYPLIETIFSETLRGTLPIIKSI